MPPGEGERPYAAYFLFLRWRRIGEQGVDGHLESAYLAHGVTADEAREALGAWSLAETREELERQIAALSAGAAPPRRWWDVMRDES